MQTARLFLTFTNSSWLQPKLVQTTFSKFVELRYFWSIENFRCRPYKISAKSCDFEKKNILLFRYFEPKLMNKPISSLEPVETPWLLLYATQRHSYWPKATFHVLIHTTSGFLRLMDEPALCRCSTLVYYELHNS